MRYREPTNNRPAFGTGLDSQSSRKWACFIKTLLGSMSEDNLGCRLFGHRFSGIITGFTHLGEAIGRCARCDVPIVHPGLRGAPPLVERNARAITAEIKAESEQERLSAGPLGIGSSSPSESLNA